MSYREYFDIDPEYFPQVDKKIIEEQPDLWKKFYPHPTFIKLLKSMVDVLSRKQKLSVWVDGAYGTGKSHAVLTLKKLIEACGIANNKNMEGEKSDNDIALTIGKLCLDNDGVVDDLKSILTKDNCKSGMLEYLKLYDGGKLPAVAEKINDGGQYINQLQYKFSSDAANWV